MQEFYVMLELFIKGTVFIIKIYILNYENIQVYGYIYICGVYLCIYL